MWTHYIFLILSMLTGDAIEGSLEQAAVPPQVEPAQLAASPAETQPATKQRVKKSPAKKRPSILPSKNEAPAATSPASSAAVAPMQVAPMQVLPMQVLPMQVAPMQVLPMQVLPMQVAPMQVLPMQVLPMQVAPPVRVAQAPDASEAIGKVQDFYNKTKSFSASFTQTVTNQTFNKLKPKVSRGRVYILKPGKMRWDYKNQSYKTSADPKVSKSFISDGKHLWAVMHKNKQYYKEDLTGSTLPVALSFLMGTGDLRKEFDVAFDTAGKFGSKSDILLVLTPKEPSARYKKLWLVVDSKDHSVKQSVVLNSKGDTNAIRFLSTKVNDTSLKPGHFIFNAKANKGFRLITPPKANE